MLPPSSPRNEKRGAQRFPAAPLFVADISRILFRCACSRRTGDGHSSPAGNRFLAGGVSRRACDRYPGRASDFHPRPGRRPGVPVWPCTAWGLSCPEGCPSGGGLLPRLFTLTASPLQARRGGFFSVTLSIGHGFRPGPPRVFRGMLPSGVRTFLSRQGESDRLSKEILGDARHEGKAGSLTKVPAGLPGLELPCGASNPVRRTMLRRP